MVVDDHAGQTDSAGRRESDGAVDLDRRPADEDIGSHRGPVDCGSGGMSSVVPGDDPQRIVDAVRLGEHPPAAPDCRTPCTRRSGACRLRRPRARDGRRCRRRSGWCPGTASGFSVIEMLTSARTRLPTDPELLVVDGQRRDVRRRTAGCPSEGDSRRVLHAGDDTLRGARPVLELIDVVADVSVGSNDSIEPDDHRSASPASISCTAAARGRSARSRRTDRSTRSTAAPNSALRFGGACHCVLPHDGQRLRVELELNHRTAALQASALETGGERGP